MKKMIIAVHGGASGDSSFITRHKRQIEEGLTESVNLAYQGLEEGKTAIDAVELAVKCLEDNPLFNAGRGSALNSLGEVEMDASIMEGRDLTAGAVSMLKCVKNPIQVARLVMEKCHHVYLSGYGALEFAKQHNVLLEEELYFVTAHQIAELQKHGTVGAVALDRWGNLAAATSTGGISNCLPGRIGDSCIIGAGCYANNQSCAVSGTGEGEYLIRGVVSNTIALLVESGMSLQAACERTIFDRNLSKGEMGVISINTKAELGIAYNTEIMKRAWKDSSGDFGVMI